MGQPIFREYDREALDREYDNRAKVADSPRYLAWYASESAAARAALPGRLDVPYGPSAAETLDVFPAAAAEPAPVQVFIHGGLYDLEPIRLCYLNETLALGPAEARRNSPVELAPVRSGPLLLAVGGLEGPEYHRQTEELARAWRARGVACTVMEMPGLDHFSIVAQLNERASKLSRAIRAQMGLV